jgi:acetyltransferase
MLVRAVRPEDEPLIVDFHRGFSEHTIRMRFFAMVRTLSRESLIRLCHLDYDREMALAAVYRDGESQPHIAGVSRYILRPETGVAEFALVVTDAWQRQGLGSHLMQRLIAIARERGAKRLSGQVLSENQPMLHLMTKLGFEVRTTGDPAVVEATLPLAEAAR